MLNRWDNNHDYHSFSNVEKVRVTHLLLVLDVNFQTKQLSGIATLELDRVDKDCCELWLDLRELTIVQVEDDAGSELDYAIDKHDPVLGQRLNIALSSLTSKVTIHYVTSANAEGLQWLTPEQTSSKKLPFLFSQSQPVNARSWIPLQDTPKARITFEASVTVPLGMRAVMSAMNDATATLNGEFTFSMEKPIPTHLLAIAVGELAFGQIGPRTGVYAEPLVLEAAVKEFEDTETMVEIAESLLGPYPWGRYDMLVLPSSFPFGGMENPRLAFMTPTLIAGDKSLVSTVAHELAHSWTGNLVSNATWRDLWLNEGFTTYFTNRIVEAVFGKEQAELEVVLEYGRLKEELATTEFAEQNLPANVQQQDPNEAFNRFTYDKASMFVHDLERRIGREAFDKFLFTYVEHFAFEAITTEIFIEYAKTTLLVEHVDKISAAELNEWVYGCGMPEYFSAPVSNSLDKVDVALTLWAKGAKANSLDTTLWRVHHWQYFLNSLPEIQTQSQLMDLDEQFKLTESTNAEIACDWFRVAIRNHYDPVLPALSDYLIRIGRGKFVRPLFSELQVAGYETEVQQIYNQARKGYHPSIVSQLDKILNFTK
ncbi:M1 family metallopeptidase [Shewanella sp. D64]|uniref:M1 family metallopeptidase n=1 Tax=unclassified Shewanella TaxID=196818 RepID=UPI0022BA1DCB|nr:MULTISPECIES: M1 family metallopeptidase [unclassified Shewanella]MEC4726457.1 M1 family metallopeptidase [Shewanella sp. D64]MEC4738469.1 M1 family metallopeptidase [Shewanella sp. E94]WBJ94130.1 M1 family metallopeptidase [Shewanella sp. MTB7]